MQKCYQRRDPFNCGLKVDHDREGQLILKCLFGVFTFFQKNEQKQVNK